ncbi:aromatic ring hydroxylating dioxygenase BbdD (plasmid) [Aminobacter sp. MSH1]|uniref:aromatic ring-hydroxylating dioxygenase subunit alpha n=1 Tax=Aminobacter sp. MSH1 TaxID=374606 RepID=UPI0009DC4EBA|nr:aromatic ring-hydroxylating dioxygenase subunit alpha [Aminobacter sp. MSH1]ARD70011.1 aromatic ring hydroxylating dioxygenase BbdD [Aminobacter sp. MSH1]
MEFLDDVWYCCALSTEMSKQPLRRVICEIPLVFFKTESGQTCVLEDRCSHRQAPLSHGEVIGEGIQCAYHGFVFGGSGRCTRIPHQDRQPAAADIRAFPIEERWGYVWVWLGGADNADPDKIPHMPWMESEDFRPVCFHFHVKANFQLMADNLLDVSHTDFLHKNTIGSQASHADFKGETKVEMSGEIEGDRVTARRKIFNTPLGKIAAGWAQTEKPVNRTNTMMWEAPNTVHSFLEFENDETNSSVHMEHIMTPETRNTTHYFMNWCRNFGLDNKSYTDDDVRRELTLVVVGEDMPMVEAQQLNLEDFPYIRDVAAKQDQFVMNVHRCLISLYEKAGKQAPREIARNHAQRKSA